MRTQPGLPILVGALNHARDHAFALALAFDELYGALNDFTGADLRNADLTGVSLEGLRWSATTQWPSDWVEQIEHGSVEGGTRDI